MNVSKKGIVIEQKMKREKKTNFQGSPKRKTQRPDCTASAKEERKKLQEVDDLSMGFKAGGCRDLSRREAGQEKDKSKRSGNTKRGALKNRGNLQQSTEMPRKRKKKDQEHPRKNF